MNENDDRNQVIDHDPNETPTRSPWGWWLTDWYDVAGAAIVVFVLIYFFGFPY